MVAGMKPINKLCVAVVDDYEPMRSLLVDALRSLGFTRFLVASNGRDAIRKMSAQPPDILIADYNMRPVSGIELTRLIRTSQTNLRPDIPIIMVTAHGEAAVVSGARDAGATEYLIKPITTKALHARIQAAIERPRPFIRGGLYIGPDRRRRPIPAPIERRKAALAPIHVRAPSRPARPHDAFAR